MAPSPPRKRTSPTTAKAAGSRAQSAAAQAVKAAPQKTLKPEKAQKPDKAQKAQAVKGPKAQAARTAPGTVRRPKQPDGTKAGRSRTDAAPAPVEQPAARDGGGHTVTITVPSLGQVANGAVNAALLPVAAARHVLPNKGGLPVYLGLGALGVADVVEWPVAVGIGLGYAVLRRGGRPAPQGGPASRGGQPTTS